MHPWIHEVKIVVRRKPLATLWNVCAGPCLLLAIMIIVVGLALNEGLAWCVPLATAIAVAGSALFTCNLLRDASRHCDSGWWGAVPIARRARSRTLVFLTGVGWLAALVVLTIAISAIAGSTSKWADLRLVLALVDGGLSIGILAAFGLVAATPHGLWRRQHVAAIPEPALAMRWLYDSRLPHVLDWQRRMGVAHWRRVAPVLAIALLAMGGGARHVIGVVLLAASFAWIAVVLKACNRATAAAMNLLVATPAKYNKARSAALRYPLFAALCATVVAACGTAILGASIAVFGIWVACVGALSAWPLWRIIQATSHTGRVV